MVNGKSSIDCLVVYLLFCLPLRATSHADQQRYEYSADAMGGTFSVALYSRGRPSADRAAAAAFSELRRLDRMLSNYRSDSEWSEVNRHAARRPVRISQELFDLLSACMRYSRQSDGAFDITVGPLVKAWGFYNGSGRPADDAEIQDALRHVGYRHVRLDSGNRTVRFARAGMELDPGGIAKGYAVDRMIEALKRDGIRRALVSAAGSSIYALGSPPGLSGWRVRIRDPINATLAGAEIPLADESLSTSGQSVKFFRADDRVFGHVLDPRSGYPVREVVQVSVVAPRTLDGEAWSKAFLVNGRSWSAGHVPAGFRAYLCDQESGRITCGWLR
jgi:thiamine biosynthesis lipoprotein